MAKHKQIMTCLHDGPTSSYCSCPHCTLSVCSVCEAYKGGLTTECPGVTSDRTDEVYKTDLDYTSEKGWHHSGVLMQNRRPLFEGQE